MSKRINAYDDYDDLLARKAKAAKMWRIKHKQDRESMNDCEQREIKETEERMALEGKIEVGCEAIRRTFGTDNTTKRTLERLVEAKDVLIEALANVRVEMEDYVKEANAVIDTKNKFDSDLMRVLDRDNWGPDRSEWVCVAQKKVYL